MWNVCADLLSSDGCEDDGGKDDSEDDMAAASGGGHRHSHSDSEEGSEEEDAGSILVCLREFVQDFMPEWNSLHADLFVGRSCRPCVYSFCITVSWVCCALNITHDDRAIEFECLSGAGPCPVAHLSRRLRS